MTTPKNKVIRGLTGDRASSSSGAQFTPGPWRMGEWRQAGSGYNLAAPSSPTEWAGAVIRTFDVWGASILAADDSVVANLTDDPETAVRPNEADARLIAAAPELYEALKAARREHTTVEDCFYSCPQAKDENGEWASCHRQGGSCNCGADAINAVIDAALKKAVL